MKLFDILKRFFTNKNKIEVRKIEKYNFPNRYSRKIEDTDDCISIDYIMPITKGNTNLYVARASKYKEDSPVSDDLADYIGFEIDSRLEEKILSSEEEKNKFMGYIANEYYIKSAQEPDNEEIFYGKIEQIANINGQTYYTTGNKDKEKYRQFLEYVNIDRYENINEYETIKYSQQENEFKEKIESEEQFKERIKYDVTQNQQEEEKERMQRIANPYLKPLLNKDESKEIIDLNGVNISKENKGDILRIRELKKRGRDVDEISFYTAYVNNVRNENQAEDFDHSRSTFICFGLYDSIENIINTGNKEEIYNILDLISNPKNSINKDGINFLGGLKKIIEKQADGHIKAKIERKDNIEEFSEQIAVHIKTAQKEYEDSGTHYKERRV